MFSYMKYYKTYSMTTILKAVLKKLDYQVKYSHAQANSFLTFSKDMTVNHYEDNNYLVDFNECKTENSIVINKLFPVYVHRSVNKVPQ